MTKQFWECSEQTQKEIADLILIDNYTPKKIDFADEDFKISKILETLAHMEKQRKEFLRDFLKKEDINQEKEFADSDLVKHTLVIKNPEGDFVKINMKERNHQEFKGTEEDLVKSIMENEQKYMSLQLRNEIKLLRNIATLGNNPKLYE